MAVFLRLVPVSDACPSGIYCRRGNVADEWCTVDRSTEVAFEDVVRLVCPPQHSALVTMVLRAYDCHGTPTCHHHDCRCFLYQFICLLTNGTVDIFEKVRKQRRTRREGEGGGGRKKKKKNILFYLVHLVLFFNLIFLFMFFFGL